MKILGSLPSLEIRLVVIVSVILIVGMTFGAVRAPAQVFDLTRIPTISEVPQSFVGTWDWATPRQSCGSGTDSYGNPLVAGIGQGGTAEEPAPLCQWPIDQLEAVMNGRGRAWMEFINGDDAVSPRWTCQMASLGTQLTEGYLRTFSKRPDALVMHFEQGNWVREVWMDGRAHPPAAVSFSHGHPVGWMEGDTLVVETTNFTWDPDGYDDHSHVARSHMATWTERYSLIDADTMELAITVKDPLFLREPFTFVGSLERTEQEMIGTWDCDPESAVRELYQTFRNPYPDDTTTDYYLSQ
jgi:hypothetical protein